jgi:hypothetical protein
MLIIEYLKSIKKMEEGKVIHHLSFFLA